MLAEGENIVVVGEYTHPEYGRQFKVHNVKEVFPL